MVLPGAQDMFHFLSAQQIRATVIIFLEVFSIDYHENNQCDSGYAGSVDKSQYVFLVILKNDCLGTWNAF